MRNNSNVLGRVCHPLRRSEGSDFYAGSVDFPSATTNRNVRGHFRRQWAIASNPSSASRSKHIDVKLHFIRGLVRAGEIQIIHVGTEDQHADILTKALWRKKFVVHRAALMNLI